MECQETKIYETLVVVCVVIGSVITYFFTSLLRQHKRNVLLQRQNSTAEVHSIERERSRIAKDLHDDVCATIGFANERLKRLELKHDDDKTQKEAVGATLDEVLVRIKEIAYDLMPSALLRKGLTAGISQLIDSITDSCPIDITFTPVEVELPMSSTINLFRVVQECLHNTVKHSKASSATISCWVDGNRLFLKMEDDGIGLDYDEQVKYATGFGLRSIRNRVEIMRGQMFVQSRPGGGLCYVFVIPLESSEREQEKIPGSLRFLKTHRPLDFPC